MEISTSGYTTARFWEEPIRLKAIDILSAVSQELGVPRHEMEGAYRSLYIIEARFTAYYFLRKYTNLSLPEIGRRVGRRDHATVINGLQKIAANPKKYERALSMVAARLGVPVR